jgi:hypothetical protein
MIKPSIDANVVPAELDFFAKTLTWLQCKTGKGYNVYLGHASHNIRICLVIFS